LAHEKDLAMEIDGRNGEEDERITISLSLSFLTKWEWEMKTKPIYISLM